MTIWLLALLAAAILAYAFARAKASHRSVGPPETLRSAGAQGTSRAPGSPRVAEASGGDDFVPSLKAIAFAEQSLAEELGSMARFAPAVGDVLAKVEAGDGAEAVRHAIALHDAGTSNPDPLLPSQTELLLLVAHAKAECGDREGAVDTLRRFLEEIRGSSHPVLQTWYRLRRLGVEPEKDEARQPLGLVVETGYPEGIDTVVAYSDGSSRFFSRQGGAVVGKERRAEVHEAARRAMAVAAPLVEMADEWTARGEVDPGRVRFTFLTPGGPRVLEVDARDLEAAKGALEALHAAVSELGARKIEGYSRDAVHMDMRR
ncbi:hypothetical protein [Pendulispora albinea]|uniref:Cell division protein ZipA n=1 Tax=Pendulispora albinea TaxID=2741071 RepID=A0ABZ2MBS6_9BACT